MQTLKKGRGTSPARPRCAPARACSSSSQRRDASGSTVCCLPCCPREASCFLRCSCAAVARIPQPASSATTRFCASIPRAWSLTKRAPLSRETNVFVSSFGVLAGTRPILYNQKKIRLSRVVIGRETLTLDFGAETHRARLGLLHEAMDENKARTLAERFFFETDAQALLDPNFPEKEEKDENGAQENGRPE